jgi:hypothetical protein
VLKPFPARKKSTTLLDTTDIQFLQDTISFIWGPLVQLLCHSCPAICAHYASIYTDLSFFDHYHFFLLLFLASWANLPIITLFPIYHLHWFMPGERGVGLGVFDFVLLY